MFLNDVYLWNIGFGLIWFDEWMEFNTCYCLLWLLSFDGVVSVVCSRCWDLLLNWDHSKACYYYVLIIFQEFILGESAICAQIK